MKERPILFSAPMVSAILSGQKTQTRRAAKPVRHPDLGNTYDPGALVLEHEPQHVIDRACPYGRPGDRLWVRETWMDLSGTGIEPITGSRSRYAYRADTPAGSYGDETRKEYGLKWRPSIFMPRGASRILLEIVSVRVERLNDISEADAIAEGVSQLDDSEGPNFWGVTIDGIHFSAPTARDCYALLWAAINGAGSWDKNPWVWVVEFKRIEPLKGED